MSWDNKQGPWGKNQRPPEIDEMLEKIQAKFREFLGGKRFPIIWILVIAALLLWLSTGIYQIDQDEVGVVQRFGKYNRTVGPGLHFKIPTGIEFVTPVNVEKERSEEFGYRTIRAGIKTTYAPEKPFESESLMLTGDLNCVLVPWTVRYRVDNAFNYLFRVRNVQKTLQDLAQATMRLTVGDHSLIEVLKNREQVAVQAQEALQEALKAAEAGLYVTGIDLGKTNVPVPVQPSFNEVNSASQEKEKIIYQAREKYNQIIPEAEGQAKKKIQEAEGYAVGRVKRAQGDATRFLALYQEFSKAKEITRARLYLEAMEKMLGRMGAKYVIDEDQKGVLPLLRLGEKGGQP